MSHDAEKENTRRRIKQAPSEKGRLGDLKPARERAMLNGKGFWAQQGRKAATGKSKADHQRTAGEDKKKGRGK